MFFFIGLALANPTVVLGDHPAGKLLEAAHSKAKVQECFPQGPPTEVKATLTFGPMGDLVKLKAKGKDKTAVRCVKERLGKVRLDKATQTTVFTWVLNRQSMIQNMALGSISMNDLPPGVGGLIGAKGTHWGTDERPVHASPSTPVQAKGAPILLGSLERKHIDGVIKESLPALGSCVKKSPTAGSVVVKFTIGPEGRVRDAGLKSTTLGQPDIESCVVEHVKKLAFDAPPGGGIVVVSYPFSISAP